MSATMNRQQDANTKEGRWLKIGEVSKESGIGIEALRFYERSGLLGKPVRSESNYRLYDEGVLDRLTLADLRAERRHPAGRREGCGRE